MNLAAIILAAGSSTRFKNNKIPKQFLNLQGKSVVQYSIDKFQSFPSINKIILVVSEEYQNKYHNFLTNQSSNLITISGGSTRMYSVYNAIQEIQKDTSIDHIIIHDAARPFFSLTMLKELVLLCQLHQAIIPVIKATDTIKRAKDHKVLETLNRNQLYHTQTPQLFERTVLIKAYKNAVNKKYAATDDSELVELLGIPIHIYESNPINFKITTETDFDYANFLITNKSELLQ